MEKQGKILYLDGLRGVAGAAVVIVHYILGFYGALYYLVPEQVHTVDGKEIAIGKSFIAIFYSGNFAVPVLFVLSAYVLSYRFFKIKNEDIVRASAIRRYFRLAIPNLAAVLLGYVLLSNKLIYASEAAKITMSSFWLGSFYQFDPSFYKVLKQGLWDGFFAYVPAESYNPAMWTMTYELMGSFLVFSFLLLFGRLSKRYIVYAAMFMLLGRSHFSAFVFGLMISDVFNSDYGSRFCSYIRSHSVLSWGLIAMGLLFTGYFDDGRNAWSVFLENDWLKSAGFDLWVVYHTAGAALILMGVLSNKTIQRLLICKPIQFIGRITYSMYLTHVVVISSVGSYAFLRFYKAGFSYGASVFGGLVCCTAVVILVAYLMTRYVDEPAIRFSRFLQKKYFSR